MSEISIQYEKERAILIALQHNKALIRIGLKVYSMDKGGDKTLISESKDYEKVWYDAHQKLIPWTK